MMKENAIGAAFLESDSDQVMLEDEQMNRKKGT